MKRILLLLGTITFLAAGCVDKQKTSDGHSDGTLITQCDTAIVVNKSCVDYATWRNEGDNKYLICNPDTNPELVYIDLSKIPNDDEYNSKKSYWLNNNGYCINYDESMKYIIKSHFLGSGYTVDVKSNYVEKSIGDLQNLGTMDPSAFGKDTYRQYLEIKVDSTDINNVLMDFQYNAKFNEFKENAYFSIPLFRSIMSKYDYSNTIFEFAIAKVTVLDTNKNNDRVVMRVKGTNQFFDMTTWPTK